MTDSLSNNDVLFKRCPLCGYGWSTREDFLDDPSVCLIGYQVNFKDLQRGLFYFNHESCRTTMAMEVESFSDLYKGELFRERLEGTEHCTSHCLYIQELRPCPAKCECASIREIIQCIRAHHDTALSDWQGTRGAISS